MKQKGDIPEEQEDKKYQPETSASSILKLKDVAWMIMKGDFNSSSKIYEIAASDSESDEMRDLAETMGMMSVKIEAREHSLEQKIDEIKSKNEQLEQAAKLQSMSGFLLSTTVILLSFYVILVSQILTTTWVNSTVQTAITYSFVAGTGLIIFLYLRKYRFPLSYWGLTFIGSKRALTESILVSIPIALFVIGLKLYLIKTPGSSFSGQPFLLSAITGVKLFIYFMNSFMQEFICRGFIQNNSERMLTGKYKSLIAILTTSMLFGVVHMHLSGTTVLITIVAGIFFGLLYIRHRTLVGVTVSHFILGYLLFELGFIG